MLLFSSLEATREVRTIYISPVMLGSSLLMPRRFAYGKKLCSMQQKTPTISPFLSRFKLVACNCTGIIAQSNLRAAQGF